MRPNTATAAASVLTLALLTLTAPTPAQAADRAPFAPPDSPPRYMPERTFDLVHRDLDLDFDWDERSVAGTATLRLTPLRPGTTEIVLHAADLEIAAVTVDGTPAAYAADPAARELRVTLPRAAGPQDALEVAVTYTANPELGLYFVGPDAAYPDKPKQIWSQGESEFNRYWFPSWDAPNDRATSSLEATVAAPFRVVSNGRLLGVDEEPDGRRTWRWAMEQEHVNYLLSVVIGDFAEVADRWGSVPVRYYVPPGREEEARRSFGDTPAMIEYYSTITGQPYPYPKYDQTCAADFIWGGMENVTATTQTLATLHPASAEPDFSSDGLVAHELAHQWFGDLITTRSWSHAWLNEGFATYFTGMWRRHHEGEDAYAWLVDDWRRAYLAEDRDRYRRPIVSRHYYEPMAMFDRHLYQKGALVLRMVHDRLGDAAFWAGIRRYVAEHKNTTVVTADFQKSMEEATGVPLGEIFDAYVYGAGHPELAVSWTWLPERKVVRLEVEQTQALDEQTGLFALAAEVSLVTAQHTVAGTHRLRLEARPRQTLELPATERPATVVFDPRGVLLASVDFDKPAAEWAAQYEARYPGADEPLAAKLQTLRALGESGGETALATLGRAVAEAPFHGTREVAAAALGKIASREALAALRPALEDADSRVRGAAYEALGGFAVLDGSDGGKTEDLIATLGAALDGDPSSAVRAAAATALGRFAERKDDAVALLLPALDQESHREVVREAALGALADLGAGEAWEAARKLAVYGAPAASRGAAMNALARLAPKDDPRRATTYDLLTGWARNDPGFGARQSAYRALAELGDRRALTLLDGVAAQERDPQQRRAARQAARQLRGSGGKGDGGDDAALRQRVEELEGEVGRLRARLEERD